MRFWTLTVFFVLVVVNLSAQCPTPSIISPNGGEELWSGKEFNVEFDYGAVESWYSDYVFFYYSLDLGENWIFIDTIFLDSTELTIDPIVNYSWLVPNIETSGCIIIVSRYEGMCWDESDGVFTISSLLSQDDSILLESSDLKISPNPVESGIDIAIESKEIRVLNVKLINLQGQEIGSYFTETGKIRIPTNNMLKGLYFIVLEHEGEIITKKVLID